MNIFVFICVLPAYMAAWCVGLVLYYTPFALKNAMAKGVAWVWFYLLRFRVNIVLHNLVHVFPRAHHQSMSQYRFSTESLCRKNLQHYVLLLGEIFERFHWTPDTLKKRVRVHQIDLFEPFKKTGMVVTSAHLGNWEMMTLTGCLLGFRLAILTKFLRNPYLDGLWIKSRERFGLELIPERHSAGMVLRALSAHKAVGLIADQFTGDPHGIVAPFLGHPAWSPKAPAVFALKSGLPLMGVFMLRDSRGNFDLYFEGPYVVSNHSGFSSLSKERQIAALVEKVNDVLSEKILKYPEQYLWIHKRFKRFLDYQGSLPWF